MEENLEKHETVVKANDSADELLELIRLDPKIAEYKTSDIIRIEEARSGSWSGVRGCCDQNTVDANAEGIFKSFLEEKIYQNRHLRYINSGHGGGTAHCRGHGGGWGGSGRSCGGNLTLQCWAEFAPY